MATFGLLAVLVTCVVVIGLLALGVIEIDDG